MSSAQYKYLKILNENALRKIIISNPRKKNSLNLVAYQEIIDALAAADEDDSVNIVAITGEGEFYSSGNDLSAFMSQHSNIEEVMATSRKILRSMIHAYIKFSKVLICVVNGPCIGIAATTAVLSDVLYASDTAYFYTPFSKLGLSAEGCASLTFPRILGKSKATEMLLLNHKLNAKEAYRFGLVAEVFVKNDLEKKLWPKIQEWSTLPKGSLSATKRLMKKFELNELEEACEQELDELYKRFMTEEFSSAILDFMSRKSKL